MAPSYGCAIGSHAKLAHMTERRRRLASFKGYGYDKGRSAVWQAAWFACLNLVFCKWWCPARVRVWMLRVFGAHVGEGVLIRHRVRVLWPWKLSIADHCWIGEGVWLLNLEPITIGPDVCISQEAFLCTGSHDRHSPSFEYDNRPITVEAGAWIGARAVILRGVSATVPACERVDRDVPANVVYNAINRAAT